jgi:hypothetical protein
MNQTWLDRCASTDAGQVATAVQLGSGEAVSSSTVDQSSVLVETGPFAGGGTSCPAPPVVTVLGHPMTFDLLSYICRFATMISGVVMVLAYLLGVKIWGGALLQ